MVPRHLGSRSSASKRPTGDHSTRSGSVASIVDLYYRPESIQSAVTLARPGGSFFYDYSEGFEESPSPVPEAQPLASPLSPIPQRVAGFVKPFLLRDDTAERLDAVVNNSLELQGGLLSFDTAIGNNTPVGALRDSCPGIESGGTISRNETPVAEPLRMESCLNRSKMVKDGQSILSVPDEASHDDQVEAKPAGGCALPSDDLACAGTKAGPESNDASFLPAATPPATSKHVGLVALVHSVIRNSLDSGSEDAVTLTSCYEKSVVSSLWSHNHGNRTEGHSRSIQVRDDMPDNDLVHVETSCQAAEVRRYSDEPITSQIEAADIRRSTTVSEQADSHVPSPRSVLPVRQRSTESSSPTAAQSLSAVPCDADRSASVIPDAGMEEHNFESFSPSNISHPSDMRYSDLPHSSSCGRRMEERGHGSCPPPKLKLRIKPGVIPRGYLDDKPADEPGACEGSKDSSLKTQLTVSKEPSIKVMGAKRRRLRLRNPKSKRQPDINQIQGTLQETSSMVQAKIVDHQQGDTNGNLSPATESALEAGKQRVRQFVLATATAKRSFVQETKLDVHDEFSDKDASVASPDETNSPRPSSTDGNLGDTCSPSFVFAAPPGPLNKRLSNIRLRMMRSHSNLRDHSSGDGLRLKTMAFTNKEENCDRGSEMAGCVASQD